MNDLSIKELMYIFKQINNRQNLLIFREVCNKWNDGINLYLNNNKFWEGMCSSESISPWIYGLLEKKYSSYFIEDYENKLYDQSMWKEIYLFYKKWRMCVFIPSVHLSFDITSSIHADDYHEKATCTDIWGDYIVVGSNIGNVRFYLIRTDYEGLYYINASNLPITEVKLWMTNSQKLIAVIIIGNQHLKFWDVEKHNYIENPSGNRSSTVAECKFYRLFVTNNLEILEYKYNRNKIYEKQRIALSSILSSSIEQPLNIIGMYISPNKLTIVGYNFPTIVTTSLDTPVLPRRNPMVISEDSSIHTTEQFPNNTSILCHVPIDEILLIIDDLFLYTAVKNPSSQKYEWRTYQLGDPLKRNISSVLLYANTLIIGTKTGLLNLYVLKNIYNFSNLSLANIPSKSFQLSVEPIIDMKIIEQRGIFHIVVMTRSTLDIVKFSKNDGEYLNGDL